MKLNRREFLCTGAATAFTAGMYGYCWESKWLELTHTEVIVGDLDKQSPVRILLLSDLHWSSFDSLDFLESAVALGTSQEPDLVCLTGDLVCVGNDYELAEYLPTLELLAGSAPAYAVLGNHDGGRWSRKRNGLADESIMADLLRESGMTVLSNSSAPITIRNRHLTLVGVPDLWAGGIDPQRAFAGVQNGRNRTTIVLAHNPDSKNLLADFDWELMVCGHTHGGQIAFPLIGAPYVPVRDKRFVGGLNAWGTKLVYTTRGVGSLYGTRFYCRPEVSIIDLL
jgi:predicted MPP superfamily phosphohydrolase